MARTDHLEQPQEPRKGGLLAMIHPQTGDLFLARRGEGALARHMILEGYEPIGPRGQAAAAVIRAQASGEAA